MFRLAKIGRSTLNEGVGAGSTSAAVNSFRCQCFARMPARSRQTSVIAGLLPIFYQLVILGSLFSTAYACQLESCTYGYTSEFDGADGLVAECAALRNYYKCVRKTASACRGQLTYHTTISVINTLMTERNCSAVAQPTARAPAASAGPAGPTVSEGSDNECDAYHGGRQDFKHCGLFGDPHLRTFDDRVQTCKVAGAWPLIDNDYLAVQVTNVALVEGYSATATDKITVILKGGHPCSEQKLYLAQTNNLPAAFVDGTKGSGPGHSVQVLEVVPGHHVEIHARFISTTLVLRQVGRYLTFAIRMPADLVGSGTQGLELCVKGCPYGEKIDFQTVLSYVEEAADGASGRIVVSREVAVAKCRQAHLSDFYFDSCVFDLITTGDANFTVSALNAQRDVVRLHPAQGSSLTNRTSVWQQPLPTEAGQGANGGTRTSGLCPTSVITLTLLVLTLTHWLRPDNMAV